jgi:predicted Fe-Mo cluster-binding NifX family protein
MNETIIIPLYDEEVAPRFDLATEVLLAERSTAEAVQEKVLILPGPSAEKLCQLIIAEGVQVLICGGIEQEFFDYLTWKRVRVIDNVIGSGRALLDLYLQNRLFPGTIVGKI